MADIVYKTPGVQRGSKSPSRSNLNRGGTKSPKGFTTAALNVPSRGPPSHSAIASAITAASAAAAKNDEKKKTSRKDRGRRCERALDIWMQGSCTSSTGAYCPVALNAIPLVTTFLSKEVNRYPWYRKKLAQSSQRARDNTPGFWLHRGDWGFPVLDFVHCDTFREAVELASRQSFTHCDISPGDYSLFSHGQEDLFGRDELGVGTISVHVKSKLCIVGRGEVTLRGQVCFERGSAGSLIKNVRIDSNLSHNVDGELSRETSSASTMNLGSASAVSIESGNVRMEECEVLSGMHGIEIGDIGPGAKAILLNNQIHHCAGSGVYVHGSACAIMVNCACDKNNRNGVCVSGDEAFLKGYMNSFKFNEHFGVRCDEGGSCHLKTSTFQENRLGDMHQEQPMNAPWFGNGQAVVIDELPAFGAWPEWPESSGDEFAGLLAAAENTPTSREPSDDEDEADKEEFFYLLRHNYPSPFGSPSASIAGSPLGSHARSRADMAEAISNLDDLATLEELEDQIENELSGTGYSHIPTPGMNQPASSSSFRRMESGSSYHADTERG